MVSSKKQQEHDGTALIKEKCSSGKQSEKMLYRLNMWRGVCQIINARREGGGIEMCGLAFSLMLKIRCPG